jgi:two-component system response regulator
MTPTLMLVEDNEDDVLLARRALGSASISHSLVVARDGVEALEHVFRRLGGVERGDLPAVILLDLKLPRLDGRGVLAALRARRETRHLPVVVLSSSDRQEDVADCYTLGANSYVRKPVSLGAFKENIGLLVFNWLQLNVPPGAEEGARRGRRQASSGVGEAEARARPSTLAHGLHTPDARSASLERGRRSPALVLDARADEREATVRALSDVAGADPVVGAASAEEALRLLRTSRGCVAQRPWRCLRLVVIDIDHNPWDGREVVENIRRQVDHRLPIVLFTRNDDPGFIDGCYDLSPNSVVRKPLLAADYADTVRLLGHYWLRINVSWTPAVGG